MDIAFLLFLQELREGALQGVLNDIAVFISDFIVSVWPLLIVAFIFWVIDKKIGRWILLSEAAGLFVNGLLKLTACIYRPWIQDARVIPAGDAMTLATGYSFPSGHATASAYYYGCFAIWQWKKRRWLSAIFIVLLALTLFSRNFLGVHTPQDVLVGFFVTFVLVIIMKKFDSFMNADVKGRDIKIMIIGIAITFAVMLYYFYKPYPFDYVEGKLLVDPMTMLPNSFEGLGAVAGFLVSWVIERRFIKFENPANKLHGIIFSLIAMVPLYFWYNEFKKAVRPVIGGMAATYIHWFVVMFYIIVVVPMIMKRVLKGNNENATEVAN